ncbi:hypothetical protein [Paracoccus sp. TOH]|uniref:hypothetical protein n=1 Tax=Paracoccus sp. TOH TaxID=1263728 RepID=UPI0025B1CE37|nr:hypothetical protein [Paracoccus sp. TOH]WJS86757.1 hypothetical protein NBE95_20055 [Paracoccus sp. TOH]
MPLQDKTIIDAGASSASGPRLGLAARREKRLRDRVARIVAAGGAAGMLAGAGTAPGMPGRWSGLADHASFVAGSAMLADGGGNSICKT